MKKLRRWITMNDVIKLIPKGKANAKRSDQIAANLGVDDDKTNWNIRNIIKMAIEDGNLIGSCKKGYYIIETADELDSVVEGLESRVHGIRTRITHLQHNWIMADANEQSSFL